ncbi:hypothetical protein I4U23_013469 [Adineta vaga]|nr:hypothetical protein I4U23_013469 [Adineta vaga]
MDSSPRTVSIIITNLEQRLRNLHSSRVHDEQTLNDLESLINECSNQLSRLSSSSDSTLVALLVPCLLQTIVSLSKICTEKSDMIISGPYLSQDHMTLLITNTKKLYNQIKELIKSPKFPILISNSPEQRNFCAQLRLVADSIANSDVLTTLICQKLIVKILTGGDDQQQSQQLSQIKIDDVNDGLIVAVYGSVLQQMTIISIKSFRDKSDNNRESPTIKMFGLYLQMLHRLIQQNNTISQIENFTDFFRTMFQLHQCLESTCQQNRFQVDFFNNTILLQEILQNFILYSISNSSKLFFDDLSLELSSTKHRYASLIFLFRIIEALDTILIKQSTDLAIHLINLLISHIFHFIDQCRMQLILPAILPISFSKTQVEYGSLYDITYSLLMRLFQHEPMQTILSSMDKLLQMTDDNLSVTSTSVQLSSELIIQSWFIYHPSIQLQYLCGLFLAELLRLDIHSSLINQLLTMPNIGLVKFHAYDTLNSSNTFHRMYDFYLNNYSKESITNSTNLSLRFPSTIEQLYPFIRLFNTELNSNQIQHTIDTCIYSIQQFLSLPIITELTCKNFLLTLRLLTFLSNTNMNENFKCLLGQLTQIFIILDEQTANDIRLELLRVFTVHSNSLDDNDLGRLLDFILTTTIESNPNSITFHLGCLDVVDSLRQRQSRSVNITDLIIQLIVRYGNEHQCSNILKAHLMRVFLAYISNGNDDSLPVRVKSQCIPLRASIDEFEKSKKNVVATDNRIPDENVLKILDSTNSTTKQKSIVDGYDIQLKFYQTIVNELEFHQCSISTQNPNEMQQD